MRFTLKIVVMPIQLILLNNSKKKSTDDQIEFLAFKSCQFIPS